MKNPHLFCFGLGYTGQALGLKLIDEGWRVSGTCRVEEEQNRLKQCGFDAFIFDGTGFDPQLLESLDRCHHILTTIPPSETGDPVLNTFKEHLPQTKNRSWFGYLSTTGVYGNRDGKWVDEESETRPVSLRGQKRLRAEREWQAFSRQHSFPLHIFRLPAIYGPGRNSLVRVLNSKAKRIDQPGLMFSRIHLDDLVQTLRASMMNPAPGSIYNVADDLPESPAEVIRFASELLDREPPPLQSIEEAGLSEMARSFYEDSKQVSNQRIKMELEVRLKFPDYRTGLTSLLNTLNK